MENMKKSIRENFGRSVWRKCSVTFNKLSISSSVSGRVIVSIEEPIMTSNMQIHRSILERHWRFILQ